MNTEFLNLRNYLDVSNASHTSTTTEYLAAFGLGGIWINWIWLKTIFRQKRSVIWKIIVLCMFLLFINSTPQLKFVWTYFILFAMYKAADDSPETELPSAAAKPVIK